MIGHEQQQVRRPGRQPRVIPDVDPIVTTLRLRRDQLHLSQADVARRMGRGGAQAVGRWEQGVNLPQLDGLRAWAGALGYDVVVVPHAATGWPVMPGVPAAGHVTSRGFWHPGKAEGCPKCQPPARTNQPTEGQRHA